MAVTADARVIGSISGGCVESDAVMLAMDVLRTGAARSARFGFSDDAARAAGLACGGSVDVLAYRISPSDARAHESLRRASVNQPETIGVLATGAAAGTFTDPSTRMSDAVARAHALRESILLEGAFEGCDLLVVSRAARPRLIVIGAGEHGAALCRVASASGYAVTVCDAWALMTTRDRFPEAAEVIAALPHEFLSGLEPLELDARSAICVLTHDERLDVPALQVALQLPVGFVGAMGARSTVARRAELLRDAGVDEASLARLHSPLGLDLGGSSAEETAISILAEIIAARNGASGRPLRELRGPLHPRSTVRAAPDEAPGVPASCAVSRGRG